MILRVKQFLMVKLAHVSGPNFVLFCGVIKQDKISIKWML